MIDIQVLTSTDFVDVSSRKIKKKQQKVTQQWSLNSHTGKKTLAYMLESFIDLEFGGKSLNMAIEGSQICPLPDIGKAVLSTTTTPHDKLLKFILHFLFFITFSFRCVVFRPVISLALDLL